MNSLCSSSSCRRVLVAGAFGLLLSLVQGCGGGNRSADTAAPALRSVATQDAVPSEAEPWQQEGARLNAAELARAQQQATPSPAAATFQRKALVRVAVYRFYNRSTGAHFISTPTAPPSATPSWRICPR